ncbi:DUF6233 domain-containing protein (plasmid) [Streptomyces sp. NBC_00868]|uniref:DUF6233 domain-containing protein n=1 Tax=Streptomyces sp. NBC_00868 TaxID=2903683 RepID=UPI002F9088BE|nr:DUF6233 domain-containing protein [Streptomyces sp. NBC_00868]
MAGRDPRALFPPDLARLEVVEQQLHALLVEVRTLIAEARRDQRLAETEHRAVPEVEWRIQHGIGAVRRPVMVHTGDCSMGMARSHPASREQAVEALAQGVEACPICRADSGLGMLEA